MPFDVRPLENFGAEVIGLDLAAEISADEKARLYRLWLDRGILLFRGAENSSDMQLRLAQCFGSLQPHPVRHIQVEGTPELIFLGSEGDVLPIQFIDGEPRRGFLYWHSDLTYVPEINKGSLLRMVEAPPSGGETGWIDTMAAYADLPTATRDRIGDLHAVHAARASPEKAWGNPAMEIRVARPDEYAPPATQQTFPPVLHPLVIPHGETGGKSLLLSPLSFVTIDELPRDEGDALFEELMQHVLQPKYRYTHRWAVGDMILWDNRRTMHMAHGYRPGDRRQCIRATLAEVQKTGRLYSEPLELA